MSRRKHAASIPHTEATIVELRTDRFFAVEYLKSVLEEQHNPQHRAVCLIALRDVAEAYGGACERGARSRRRPRGVVSGAVSERQPDTQDASGSASCCRYMSVRCASRAYSGSRLRLSFT